MSAQVTLSVRSIVVSAVVALALVTAYLLGDAGGGNLPAQAADDADPGPADARVLTMSGTGDATAVPDQLSFELTVTLTRPSLESALDDANATMDRVLDGLKGHGVDKSDVQTTDLSMDAVYVYHESAPPTISGYHVSQRASVLVDELKDGGAAVSAAVAAGGNAVRVGNIRLLVGDTDAVMKRARDAAVEEALTKAQQYAAAAGQDLGDVVTLQEVRTVPAPSSPVAGLDRRAVAAGLDAVPIRAGKDRSSVTVRVVWELR